MITKIVLLSALLCCTFLAISQSQPKQNVRLIVNYDNEERFLIKDTTNNLCILFFHDFEENYKVYVDDSLILSISDTSKKNSWNHKCYNRNTLNPQFSLLKLVNEKGIEVFSIVIDNRYKVLKIANSPIDGWMVTFTNNGMEIE